MDEDTKKLEVLKELYEQPVPPIANDHDHSATIQGVAINKQVYRLMQEQVQSQRYERTLNDMVNRAVWMLIKAREQVDPEGGAIPCTLLDVESAEISRQQDEFQLKADEWDTAVHKVVASGSQDALRHTRDEYEKKLQEVTKDRRTHPYVTNLYEQKINDILHRLNSNITHVSLRPVDFVDTTIKVTDADTGEVLYEYWTEDGKPEPRPRPAWLEELYKNEYPA